MADRGECAAQRRLSEAEADMDERNWEQRSSDGAFYMKPIENSNLKDWSCTRRISGLIRLTEYDDRHIDYIKYLFSFLN